MFFIDFKCKKIFILLLSINLFLLTILPVFASSPTNNTTQQTIKVAFIQDGNFYIVNSNGEYSGYNYDYLTKIAQFTNWNYEFVIINEETLEQSYDKAFEMLENGEIDLIGSQELTPEKLANLEFGKNHYGVVRTTLSSLANNHNVTRNNFFLKDTLRASLVKGADTANTIFFQLMAKYDIDPIVTYVDTRDQALQMIIAEESDVIMSTDFSTFHNSLATLYSDNPVPIYFAAKKGNTDIVNQLDDAIDQIQITTLTISQELQERYFGNEHTSNLIRTVSEDEALSNLKHLNIGFVAGIEPYQFYDPSTNEFSGIAVEIFESISKIIDFPFVFHWYDNHDDIIDAIENQEIDIFATLPYDFSISNDVQVNLSQPYISNRATWVYRFDTYSSYDDAYKYFVSDNIPYYLAQNLDYIYDGTDIFKQISEEGKAVLFCDPFIAQYTLQSLNITNLEMRSVPNIYSHVSMGVSKHVDPIILGLLNHSILHLDSYFIDEVIHRNTMLNEEVTFQTYFKHHSTQIIIALVILFLIILSVLSFYTIKFRELSKQDSLTKLVNAGYFHKYAEDNTHKMQHGCLIIVDIDNFKQINDQHGHHVGDDIIKNVSQILLSNFRAQDVIGRLGGDEFIILLQYNATIDELNSRAKQLLKTLADSSSIDVTLSIGGISFSEPMFYDNLYRLTDEVLYSVKNNGRNGFAFKEYP